MTAPAPRMTNATWRGLHPDSDFVDPPPVPEPGFPLLGADEFFQEEPSTALVVPGLGICAGPVTGLVGEAYSGKTLAAFAMGMAAATGQKAWGLWDVAQGPWLHLDYEQGRRHTKNRVLRMARGMGITEAELHGLIADGAVRLSVYPTVNLTSPGAVDSFARVFAGVRLVTCDSLRLMIGAARESDSEVRTLISVLSRASDKTGAATLLLHHAGKEASGGDAGPRRRKDRSRGSTGIVDEFQSYFFMSKNKGDSAALVSHEKDRELGYTVDDFGLRIDDVSGSDTVDPQWGLRLTAVDAKQLQREGEARSVAPLLGRILHALRGGPMSVSQLKSELGISGSHWARVSQHLIGNVVETLEPSRTGGSPTKLLRLQ